MFLNVCKQTFHKSHMCMSQKVKGVLIWNLEHIIFISRRIQWRVFKPALVYFENFKIFAGKHMCFHLDLHTCFEEHLRLQLLLPISAKSPTLDVWLRFEYASDICGDGLVVQVLINNYKVPNSNSRWEHAIWY